MEQEISGKDFFQKYEIDRITNVTEWNEWLQLGNKLGTDKWCV